MNINSLNNWILQDLSPYLNSAMDADNIRYIFSKTVDAFNAQTENCVFIGFGLSAVGTAYTYLCNNTNQWMFYGSACVVCLGTAYRQGWLKQALCEAQNELEKVKRNLAVAEIALSDRELLLEAITKAGENEKKLQDELAEMKKQQEILSGITTELTALLSFFKGLKTSYPDEKTFFKHLSSIEKVEQAVKTQLEKNDSKAAFRFLEMMDFLKGLNEKSVDQMALLLVIKEGVGNIERGVDKANGSLDELKGAKEMSA